MKRAHSLFSDRTPLDLYFAEIADFCPLTFEETRVLYERYKRDGDVDARNVIICSLLQFIVSRARRRRDDDPDIWADRIANGALGLVRALEDYDPRRGFCLDSYAVRWIDHAIDEGRAEGEGAVSHPLSFVNDVRKMRAVRKKLEHRTGKKVSLDTALEAIGFSEKRRASFANAATDHRSFDHPLFDDPESGTLHDLIPQTSFTIPVESFEESYRTELLTRLLDTLDARERDVVVLYYGLENEPPHTLEEIGERFERSHETIRKILEGARKKLREAAQSMCGIAVNGTNGHHNGNGRKRRSKD